MKVESSKLFTRCLRKLKKRFPSAGAEVKATAIAIASDEEPGDRISGTTYPAYKVRLANRDAKRGKSGGFRLIYYIVIDEAAYLLVLYSKTERGSYTAAEINQMIRDEGLQ